MQTQLRAGDEIRPDDPARPGALRLALLLGAVAAASVGLFFGYLQFARRYATNADGASNALQAWDMLHGNVLLHQWTLSDVSFYTTELPQYALVQLVYGFNSDMVHVAAAMTYTLIVLLVAVLAKGRATGWAAAARIGLALAIVAVPAPGIGYLTTLSSPNHTGTAVPVLVTWLVLDRAQHRKPLSWLPYLMVVLLAWGQIGDPLVTFIAALPLVVVCGYRLIRDDRPWRDRLRGLDARLLAAGVVSVLVTHAFLRILEAAGGFRVHPAGIALSQASKLDDRVRMTVQTTAGIFGAYFPDAHGPFQLGLAGLRLVAIAVVFAAVAVVVVRAIRPTGSRGDGATAGRPSGKRNWRQDRVLQVIAVGIVVNLGAYVVSALPLDMGASRETIAVVPLGAVLAGRIFGRKLLRLRLAPVLAAVLVLLAGFFVVQSANRGVPAERQDVADWLVSRNLRYGIGNYWTANNITLASKGRTQVVPVAGATEITAYHWESRGDWYDPARHDARFFVLDLRQPENTVESAVAQFGSPVERHDFGTATVLIYDHNLLAELIPSG
jgi:hypothetical protein